MTGEMDREAQEDILDRCIQRLLQGESLDGVLRSYPDQQPRLRAALEPAVDLLRSSTPGPSLRAQYAARQAMMSQVRAEAERPESPGVLRWLGTLRARPLAFQALAVVAAIAVFSSVGLGASAATGTAPEPIGDWFRISSNQASVRVTGPIVSIQRGLLVVYAPSGYRTIEITPATMISRGSHQVNVTDLAVGETVLVIASEVRDGNPVAREVRAAVPPTATPSATIGAPAPQQSDEDATGTPSEEPADRDGQGDHPRRGTATPEGHDGEGEHARTPEGQATSANDDGHSTRTPGHGDSTRTPEPSDTPEKQDN